MATDFIRRMTRARLGVVLVALSIPLLLLLLLMWWRIEAGAQRLLAPLRWFGDVAYESMSVGFDGTVRFENVRFQPYPGMKGAPVTAESIAVVTPGLTWLLDGGLSRSVTDVADLRANLPSRLGRRLSDASGWSLPPAATLQASVEGIELTGEPPEIPGFEWLGFTSASPFESYGCGATRHWTRTDLRAMGLSDTRQRMRVGYESITNELADVTARLETDNASAAQFTLRLGVPDASRLPMMDWRNAHIALRSWQVEDAGFVMARNWFCARRVGVSRLEFVEHHLSAIRRNLFEQGAVPATALSNAYRRFVERGGELSLESRPTGKPTIADLARVAPADRLRELNAMLKSRGGPAVPFTLDFDVAKLGSFMGPPTLEDQMSMGYVPPPTPAPAAVVAPITETPTPTPTPAATPAPSPTPTAIASLEPEPVATPRPVPTPVPTSAPNATPTPAATPIPSPVAGSIPYAQLARYVGRTITVRTTLGGRRTGVLLAHNPQAITLKLSHAREGALVLTIPQKTIRSAVAAGVATTDHGADGAETN